MKNKPFSSSKPFCNFLFTPSLLLSCLLLLQQWQTAQAVCPKTCACRQDVIMCQSGDWASIQSAIAATMGLERIVLEKDVTGLDALEDNSFVNCDALKMLKINGLSLQTIGSNAFARCTGLVDLDLSNNRLARLNPDSFSGLSNLKSLGLAKNKLSILSDAEFAPLTNLKTLDISHNAISTIQTNAFSRCTALVDLNLSYNNLANLKLGSFSGLSNLKSLNLANNQLSSLVEVFTPLVNLKTLDITHNVIRDLSKSVFKTQASLTMLALSGNRLNQLTSQAFVGLDSVQEIRLRDCNLFDLEMDLFSHTKKISFLDLGHNKFSNPLSQAVLTDLTTLRILLFDNNKFQRLENNAFTHLYLQTLDLSFNRITSIEELAFQNATVKELDLSDNMILPLNSKFLHPLADDLIALTLAGNPFEKIRADIFSNCKHLERLNVSSCRLTVMDHISLQDMPKLNALDISHNNLAFLSQDMLNSFSGLKSIVLHENNWICDYHIRPLITWLGKSENLAKMQCHLSRRVHQDCGILRCALPKEFFKKSLLTLDKDSIEDEVTDKDSSSLPASAQGAIVAACLGFAIIFLIITVYLWRNGKTGLKLKRVCVPSNAESSHMIDEDSKVPPLSNCDRVSLNVSDHEFVVRHYFDTYVSDPKLMSRTSDSEEPKSPKERDSMYSSQPSVYNNEHAPMGIESTV